MKYKHYIMTRVYWVTIKKYIDEDEDNNNPGPQEQPIIFSTLEKAKNYVCEYLVKYIEEGDYNPYGPIARRYQYCLTMPQQRVKDEYKLNYDFLQRMVDLVRIGKRGFYNRMIIKAITLDQI